MSDNQGYGTGPRRIHCARNHSSIIEVLQAALRSVEEKKLVAWFIDNEQYQGQFSFVENLKV